MVTQAEINFWVKVQEDKGLDLSRIKKRLKSMVLETPSWGYGDSGTRFKVFKQKGVARNPYEKLEDAATVHRLTGVCSKVAIQYSLGRSG